MEPELPFFAGSPLFLLGAAFFCLEPELTQFGRSQIRSRLRDLGLPEPPKKWRLCNTGSFHLLLMKNEKFVEQFVKIGHNILPKS